MNSKHPAPITLKLIECFRQLSPQELEKLARKCEMRSYRSNALVVAQNEPANYVCFIVSGYVKIMRGDRQAPNRSSDSIEANGKCMLVDLLGPGDSLGAASLLLGECYSSSAITLTPSEIVFLGREDFTNFLYEFDGLSEVVMSSLAKSLIAIEKHAHLMNGDLKNRVFEMRKRCQDLGVDVERWLTNAELARMVGATRVAVSQIMNHKKRTLHAALGAGNRQ